MSLPSTDATLASSSWQRLAPVGAGFSVMMPGLPDEAFKNMTQGPNPVGLREYRFKADDAEYVLGVLLNLPVEITQQPDFAEGYFQLLPLGMIKSAEHAGKNYRLTAQRSISIKDYPGRQYKFDSPEYTCTMRAYLIGQTVYIMSVESRKASVPLENVERFFSSFALTEN